MFWGTRDEKPHVLRAEKQGALEPCGGPAAGGLGPGGGDLGEFTLGKRWGFLAEFSLSASSRCAHGPSLEHKCSVGRILWGWRPQTGPLSNGLCTSGAQLSRKTFWRLISSPRSGPRAAPEGTREAPERPKVAPVRLQKGQRKDPERPRVAKSRQPALLARSEP